VGERHCDYIPLVGDKYWCRFPIEKIDTWDTLHYLEKDITWGNCGNYLINSWRPEETWPMALCDTRYVRFLIIKNDKNVFMCLWLYHGSERKTGKNKGSVHVMLTI